MNSTVCYGEMEMVRVVYHNNPDDMCNEDMLRFAAWIVEHVDLASLSAESKFATARTADTAETNSYRGDGSPACEFGED